MKQSELDEINCLRRSEGLPPIEPAIVSCLRCDTKFESWDKRNNRICSECKNSDEYGEQFETYDVVLDSVNDMITPRTITDDLLALWNRNKTHFVYPDDLLDTTLMDREDL